LGIVKESEDAATNLRVVKAANSTALVCYRSGSGGDTTASALYPYPGVCSAVHLEGTHLVKGPEFVIGSTSQAGLQVMSWSDGAILACYNPHWSTDVGIRCTLIQCSGLVLTRAADIDVDSTSDAATDFRMARSSDQVATLCYLQARIIGMCSSIELHGNGSLSKGPNFQLGSVAEAGGGSVALTSFSENVSIACYNHKHAGQIEFVCTALNASSNQILRGTDVVVDMGTSASQITVAAFSPEVGAVCYRVAQFNARLPYAGTCVQLRLANATLSLGRAVTFGSASGMGISLEVFSAEYAFACYTPRSSGSVSLGLMCNVLEVSGEWLLKGSDLVLSSSDVSQVHISSLSSTTVMICFRELLAADATSHVAICVHVEVDEYGSALLLLPGRVIGPASYNGVNVAGLSAASSLACYNPSQRSYLGLVCNNIEVDCNICGSRTAFITEATYRDAGQSWECRDVSSSCADAAKYPGGYTARQRFFQGSACCKSSVRRFELVGLGFCRPANCSEWDRSCRTDGWYKDNSSHHECESSCNSQENCSGFAFSSWSNIGAPHRCFLYGTREDVPSGWTASLSGRSDIGGSSGAVGVQCFRLEMSPVQPAITTTTTTMMTTTATTTKTTSMRSTTPVAAGTKTATVQTSTGLTSTSSGNSSLSRTSAEDLSTSLASNLQEFEQRAFPSLSTCLRMWTASVLFISTAFVANIDVMY